MEQTLVRQMVTRPKHQSNAASAKPWEQQCDDSLISKTPVTRREWDKGRFDELSKSNPYLDVV